MKRLLGSSPESRDKRFIPIEKVTGVTIGEHPWERMMAGKKPADEPLARLVPHDHYYVAFKNFRAFLEFGDVFDDWGTNALRAYDANSRDHQLKQRYDTPQNVASPGSRTSKKRVMCHSRRARPPPKSCSLSVPPKPNQSGAITRCD